MIHFYLTSTWIFAKNLKVWTFEQRAVCSMLASWNMHFVRRSAKQFLLPNKELVVFAKKNKRYIYWFGLKWVYFWLPFEGLVSYMNQLRIVFSICVWTNIALLVQTHNVLLERVQSNLKLAPPRQQQPCRVKTLQYCGNSNIFTHEADFLVLVFFIVMSSAFESPISWGKYLAGCQKRQ